MRWAALSESCCIVWDGDWQWTLSITSNYIATHRDPGMRALYRDYIAMFRAAGVPSRGFPFLHFGSTGFPSPYGSFSVLEFTGQVRGEPIVHGWLDVCVAASRLARRLKLIFRIASD